MNSDESIKKLKGKSRPIVVQKDRVEILDAIGDQCFILFGTAAEHGISQQLFDRVFNEIKDSNYSRIPFCKICT